MLAPTATVRGSVNAARDHGQLTVSAETSSSYRVIAPVRPDGSFELAGLPIGSIRLQTVRNDGSRTSGGISRTVRTGPTALANIELAAPTDRTLAVIVRSATGMPVDGADVTVVEGTIHVETMAALEAALTRQSANDLARAIVDTPTAELAPLIRRGDVIAQIRGVPLGPVSVCARGFHVDMVDQDTFWAKYHATEAAQPVRCVSVGAAATHAVVEVGPMNRVE